MSLTLPPQAIPIPSDLTGLIAGTTVPITIPGDMGAVTWVMVANESPCALIVGFGASYSWLDPYTLNAYPVEVNSSIYLTPYNVLGVSSGAAPVSFALVTWYGVGEQPAGTYPVALPRLTNVGNQFAVANELVNNGNPSGTTIITSTPGAAIDPYVFARNDGTFDLKAISSNVETDMFHLTVGGVSTPAKIVMQLVQILGALSADSGAITTDGNGTMTLRNLTLGSVAGGNTISAIQDADMDFDMFPTGSPGSAYGFIFAPWTGSGTQNIFGIAPNSTAGLFCWFDLAGVLHTTAPHTIITGNQIAGQAGAQAVATAGSQGIGVSVTYPGVCTNVPSSITLTLVSSTNAASPGTASITKTGFFFNFLSSAAGDSGWRGTYVTVGNCLLGVDSVAQTFAHHCDGCQTVRQAIPLTELDYRSSGFNGSQLAYHCVCGTSECFNADLTAADEQDTTPQGSGQYATTRGAQATLIRQLMTLANLPLAA